MKSSSLFVCVQHMVKMSYDVVKRWVNEAQEAASSDNIMVQVDNTGYIQTLSFMLCVCIDTVGGYC